MPDSRDARKKVKIAIAALLAVDVAAALVFFSPLVGSERSRREQLDQLWRELQQKTRAAEPLRDFDKKIVTARQQIDDFYKNRLPAQDSAIYEEVGKLAGQNGVRIGQIRSKAKDTESVGLRPVEIESQWTARRREHLGAVPIALKAHPPAQNAGRVEQPILGIIERVGQPHRTRPPRRGGRCWGRM